MFGIFISSSSFFNDVHYFVEHTFIVSGREEEKYQKVKLLGSRGKV